MFIQWLECSLGQQQALYTLCESIFHFERCGLLTNCYWCDTTILVIDVATIIRTQHVYYNTGAE